jgi:hypothetical protein
VSKKNTNTTTTEEDDYLEHVGERRRDGSVRQHGEGEAVRLVRLVVGVLPEYDDLDPGQRTRVERFKDLLARRKHERRTIGLRCLPSTLVVVVSFLFQRGPPLGVEEALQGAKVRLLELVGERTTP